MAESGAIDWRKGVLESSVRSTDGDVEEGNSSYMYPIWTRLQTTENVRFGLMLRKPIPELCTIQVKWEESPVAPSSSPIVCHQSHANRGNSSTADETNKGISYDSIYSNQLLQMEGLTDALSVADRYFTKDPIGPRYVSAVMPPPIKKVVAIYGINLPTEVAAVYRRSPTVRVSMENSHVKMKQMFVLDSEATLSRNTHVIEGGIIREMSKTPQKIVGGGVEQKSGDGTVPYDSLQHCRSWQGPCDVTVHELDGAEHRGILNDNNCTL